MIKAICFDLDGVYFLNGKSNFIFSLRDLGVSEEVAKIIFLQSDKMNKEYKTGTISDTAFWTWAIWQWKLRDKSVSDMINLLISGYQINREAVEFIRRARKVGYKALVCTNNFPARIIGLNEKFSFLRDFDVVVTSYETHVIKPQKEIFEELVKKTEVDPSEIVLIDDDVSKLEGARELGINLIEYKDFPGMVKSLEEFGVLV